MSVLPPQWGAALLSDVGADGEQAVLTGPFGANLGKEDFVASGVPIFTIGCLGSDGIERSKLLYVSKQKAEELRAYRLREGDFLFSRMASVGRAGFVPTDLSGALFNYHLMRLRLNSDVIIPKLFFYYVRGSEVVREYLDAVSRGATRDGINTKLLRNMPVQVPPTAEQRRIVAKIDALSAKSRRASEQLDHIPRLVEKYKQAILAAAFRGQLTQVWRKAQFDIETADQLVARTPEPSQSRGGREATTNIKAGIAGLSVNDPGIPSPSGWCWVSLRRIARQETGHTPSRSHPEYWDGTIPWIGIVDAGNHHGRIINDTLQTVSKKGVANSSTRLLPAGTVCLSRTASVGYVTIMGRPMCTSQDFATWSCSSALVPKYLMYLLMAEGKNIREFGEGSTHTTIYFPEIRALHICLAPLAEQQEVVRRIEIALAWVDRIASECIGARKLMAHLDQTILAKAFRGELVPQDPNDEPASMLLERIRAERQATPIPRNRGKMEKAPKKGVKRKAKGRRRRA
jgi:type I restriction enzyme, S subunit